MAIATSVRDHGASPWHPEALGLGPPVATSVSDHGASPWHPEALGPAGVATKREAPRGKPVASKDRQVENSPPRSCWPESSKSETGLPIGRLAFPLISSHSFHFLSIPLKGAESLSSKGRVK